MEVVECKDEILDRFEVCWRRRRVVRRGHSATVGDKVAVTGVEAALLAKSDPTTHVRVRDGGPEGKDFMSEEASAVALEEAAADEAAGTFRRAVVRSLSTGFDQLGELLLTAGNIVGRQRVDGTSPFSNGDDGVVALGYASQAGGSLVSGASRLIDARNVYGAAALVRQLLEVEQLVLLFGVDHEEAVAWLRSDEHERRQRFQPRHVRTRSRGRFAAEGVYYCGASAGAGRCGCACRGSGSAGG